jgi:prepilin-type N-terminal cleavage/methylation domain-containing protein
LIQSPVNFKGFGGNHSCKRLGYSLPELLITILLLAILFSLAIIFSSGLSQTKRIRDYSLAIAFAQQAVEIVRAAPYSLLDEEDAGINSVEEDFKVDSGPTDSLKPEYKSGGITYKRKVEISNVMAAEDDKRPVGLKLVKIKVDWKTMDGVQAEPFIIETTVADMN